MSFYRMLLLFLSQFFLTCNAKYTEVTQNNVGASLVFEVEAGLTAVVNAG